jgi:TonB family protein
MRRHARRWASVRRARRILQLLLALAAVPGANAQQTAMDAAAGPLAGAIIHSKQRTLAILDFSGRKKRVQGVVELVAVVGEDGRLTNIAVVKGLPGGLTVQAIEAVKKWRLKPATGPDGKPAAVQQIIEVTFQMF